METKQFYILTTIFCGIMITSNAQEWSPVGDGIEDPVNTFTEYNGNLFAASSGIFEWNGSNWVGMNSGLFSFSAGNLNALCVSNGNNLYVGGENFFVLCPDNDLYTNASRFNGSQWTTVGNGLGNDGLGMNNTISAMASFHGILYAGGNFSTAGGDPLRSYDREDNLASYIANFRGNSCCWDSVGGGMNDVIRELVPDTIRKLLYAAGYFTVAGGVSANHIAQWNESSWSALGSGTNGKITALCIHNGDVYVGGLFSNAGGIAANNVAKWNGSSWSALGSGLNGQIYDLASYNGALYAGGENFTLGSDIHHIAKWDGKNWSALGSGVDDSVSKLFVFNDALYVGGSFLNAGGSPANHVAKWKSPPTNLEECSINNALSIQPNPAKYVFSLFMDKNSNTEVTMNIYNIMGALFKTEALKQNQQEINIGGLANGIYLVECKSIDWNAKQKLIIRR
ncbi:MAG: T9SS type A sorting domain-containing protein [Bacteroidota bacterium]|nr:T9SS type A sorting domain-containing protein [Bacteroidota bacterium]